MSEAERAMVKYTARMVKIFLVSTRDCHIGGRLVVEKDYYIKSPRESRYICSEEVMCCNPQRLHEELRLNCWLQKDKRGVVAKNEVSWG